ncbi:Embryonic stem cell-specific 5-hydroxymethylcytosine-binding protein [Phytophthora citrophthora]|uniref:Embryonic stem cell-specific 5-hydroxymethylcytosine-binding protein n=1 Tax=Phytophthora citrophthora TaxID=4793 RepID=A0AAD9GZ16_9STRA|nr:Embryonic stem cell-specific 5-hydroxymethylcytosine-binding protein [Phytophthora citrophthora]
MCGRARCVLARGEVAEAAGVEPKDFVDGDKYKPVENMGPGRYGPIMVQHGGAKVETEKKAMTRLQAMRWGLVPSFTKANAKPDHFLMFNARSENLQERPAFKRLLETKRCVVLCDGYYEWQQVDKREKQPYYFFREGSPMKFAGLYDQWKSEDGELMCTYTILTTAVAPELKWLHTRMPVILSGDGVDRWLSGAKFEELKDLLISYQSTDLKWHPVDKKVGSMKFQSEDCSKKVNIKHAGDIKSFFGVKTEKQEPNVSSPLATTHEDIPASSTVSSPPVKNEELEESNPDTTPKKEFNQFPTNFVPASSLLNNKRFEDETQKTSPSQSPSKRRRMSSPAKSDKKSKLKSPPGPKQSSLDFFFGKAHKN